MPQRGAINLVVAKIAASVGCLQGVAAMSLGGSTQSGLADPSSDLDIHVYWLPPLAEPAERKMRLAQVAVPRSIRVGVQSWGLEDHFTVDGLPVELIYTPLGELQHSVATAYSVGLDGEECTTAWLYSVAHDQPVHDPNDVLAAMRERLADFPEPTYRALLQHRAPLLLVNSRYLRRAQERSDLLCVQQLRASVQALFFNLLFTLNRMYHPGGKRLLMNSAHCRLQPPTCGERWQAIARLPADAPQLADQIEALAGELFALIQQRSGLEISDEAW